MGIAGGVASVARTVVPEGGAVLRHGVSCVERRVGRRGRSDVFRGGARCLPSRGGRGRSDVSESGPGHPVGATPGAHRYVGSLGAAGTYSRAGPEGSVGKFAHRTVECAGPLGRIPRRGPRSPNRSAEPPGRNPGSGSAGLYNYMVAIAPRRKTRLSNQFKINMMMNAVKGNSCGVSELRERQGESTVPAVPRSCQFGKSCVGLKILSVSLAASDTDGHAIASMCSACPAGVPYINTPAKDGACGGALLPRCRKKEEERGKTLRLKGGGEGEEDSDTVAGEGLEEPAEQSCQVSEVSLIQGSPRADGASVLEALLRLNKNEIDIYKASVSRQKEVDKKEKARDRQGHKEGRSTTGGRATRPNQIMSDSESSSENISGPESRSRSLTRTDKIKRRSDRNPRRTQSDDEGNGENVQFIGPTQRPEKEKIGPGRPPTTGEHDLIVKALREEHRRFQQSMEQRMQEMQEALRRANETAEAERARAEGYLRLLEKEKTEKEERERSIAASYMAEIQEIKSKLAWMQRSQKLEGWDEPMEIGEETNTKVKKDEWAEKHRNKEKEEFPPLPKRLEATEEELKEFPVKRPSIQGKVKILEDRPIDILTEKNEKGNMVALPIRKMVTKIKEANRKTLGGEKKPEFSKKKKKEVIKPNWGEMEAFSSLDEEPIPENKMERANYYIKNLLEILTEGNVESPVREENKKPISFSRAPKVPPSKGKKISEARKAKKKEKRREKRREEARRRLGASAPPPPPPMENATRGAGPMTRSRSGAAPATRALTLPSPSPTHPRTDTTQWSRVLGRREKKEARQGGQSPATKAFIVAGPAQRKGERNGASTATAQVRLKKAPRTAAVQITCPEGQRAETMRLARARVNPEELGIQDMKPRRAQTGALLFEIPGEEGARKADLLAEKLRQALAEKEGVVITRPQKMAEIRIRDVIESVTEEEVTQILAEKGRCHLSDIKVGPIRQAPNGLGAAWIRCPLTAAKRITEEGTIRIGWAKVRIEVLPDRTQRCFRCWGKGHVRALCTSEVDRTEACYKCGDTGHLAKNCSAPARCAICAETSRPANHRAGGPACKAPAPRRGRIKRANKAPTPESASTAAAPPGGGTPMEVDLEVSRNPHPKRPASGAQRGGNPAKRVGLNRGEAIPPPPPSSTQKMEVETVAPTRGASAPSNPPTTTEKGMQENGESVMAEKANDRT